MRRETTEIFDKAYAGDGLYFNRGIPGRFRRHAEALRADFGAALDLGCGDGRYTCYLAKQGFSVTAVDVSRTGLAKLAGAGRSSRTKIKTLCLDLTEFVFESCRYEIVVAATVLDHLDDPVRQRVAAGIKETLAPGGLAYIDVFTQEDPGYRQRARPSPASSRTELISECESCVKYYFAPGELRDLFIDLSIEHYSEGPLIDTGHGPAHRHVLARLIAKKPISSG